MCDAGGVARRTIGRTLSINVNGGDSLARESDPIHCLRSSGLRQKATSQLVTGAFLADRTIGRAYGTVCRLSVCL